MKRESKKKSFFNKFRKGIFASVLGLLIFSGGVIFTGCAEKGADGQPGQPGAPGSMIYTGHNEPTLENNPGRIGDIYLEKDGDVWKMTENGWEFFININGDNGRNGSQWHTGIGEPQDSLGYDGDLYFDTASCSVYQRKYGSWTWLSNLRIDVEINEDGYWVINGFVTEIKARGENGTTPTISINKDGYWVINGEVTDVNAYGWDNKVLVSKPLQWTDLIGKKITLFGDSITFGVGTTEDKGGEIQYPNAYGQLLAEKLCAEIDNRAKSGSTLTSGVQDKHGTNRVFMLDDIKAYTDQTDYILIMLGTNDFDSAESALSGPIQLGKAGSTDTTTIYGALEQYASYLSKYKDTGTKVYFVTPIIQGSEGWDPTRVNDLGYSQRDLCEAIIEVAAKYEIPTLDLNTKSGIYYNSSTDNNVSGIYNETMKDHLHPNDAGHELISDAIANFLKENYSFAPVSDTRKVILNSATKSTTHTVYVDHEFELPHLTEQGKILLGWKDSNGRYYAAGHKLVVSTNMSFVAVFAANYDPIVKIVNLNGGISSHNYLSVAPGKTIAETQPSFEVSNTLGLVASYYTDKECTQEFNLATDIVTQDMTLYVYWETNPSYFLYNTNGNKIIGLNTDYATNQFVKNPSLIEKIILPRYSYSTGSKVKILEATVSSTNTTEPFFNVLPGQLTSLKEFIIPEGYIRVDGLFMSRNAAQTIPEGVSGYNLYIPKSMNDMGTSPFVNSYVKKFIIAEGNPTFKTNEGGTVLLMWSGTQIKRIAAMAGITEFSTNIEGVNSLPQYAFYGNKILEKLTICDNITNTLHYNSIDGLYNMTTLILDFDVNKMSSSGKSTVLTREFFANITNSSWALINEGSSIYVKSEQDKTYLTNLILYGKFDPVIEPGNGAILDEIITTDGLYTSGNYQKLIDNIKVMPFEE